MNSFSGRKLYILIICDLFDDVVSNDKLGYVVRLNACIGESVCRDPERKPQLRGCTIIKLNVS